VTAPLTKLITAALLVSALLAPLAQAPCQDPLSLLSGALVRQAPPVLPDQAFALDTVPEDLNADGIVNAADLGVFTADWRASKAGGEAKARSDFDGDGDIDTTDSERILQFVAYCAEHGAYTKPVGRAEIGPAGGTLKGPGFQLTVPSGAFAAARKLALYRLPQRPDADPASASDTYEVQGLPSAFAEPLTISLAPDPGSPTDGASFVRVLERGFARGVTGKAHSMLPLSATPSGGNLVAEIPSTAEAGSGTDAPDADAPSSSVYSLFRGLRQLDLGRYRYIYSKRVGQDAIERLHVFGAEADRRLDWLYDLNWGRRTRYPIEVWVEPLAPELWASCSIGVRGVNYVTIELNSLRCFDQKQLNQLGAAFGHEIFHLYQYLYDSRGAWAMASRGTDWLWFEEATAVDLEFDLGDLWTAPGESFPIPTAVYNPDASSQESSDNWAFPVNHGLEFPYSEGRSGAQEHGYGASMFVHNRLTHRQIGDLFKAHYADPSLRPCTALSDLWASTYGLAVQYANFAMGWLAGTVWGSQVHTPFPKPELMLGTRANVVNLDRQSGFTWKRDLQDLSLWNMIIRPDPEAAKLPLYHNVVIDIASPESVYSEFYFFDKEGTGQDGVITWRRITYGTDKHWDLPFKPHASGQVLLSVMNLRAVGPYTARTRITLRGQARPELASLEPRSCPPGTVLTIKGCGFGKDEGKVLWGVYEPPHVPLNIAYWSNNEIWAYSPATSLPSYPRDACVVVQVPGPGDPGGPGLKSNYMCYAVTAPPP